MCGYTNWGAANGLYAELHYFLPMFVIHSALSPIPTASFLVICKTNTTFKNKLKTLPHYEVNPFPVLL